eukprot:NODE_1507_length_1507_cov_67.012346_g1360_i0.p1 GENE.NODE_1507_length_1507_cov_67.012346_g1360_i0~~NODE_1507_length_1507_cov_67.012346_g1360_i0.p1  ORF type:complete len:327 (-),score=22.29 NODE_1507_length_1507_cov_67.012346_g1360_i0:455-1435(-)
MLFPSGFIENFPVRGYTCTQKGRCVAASHDLEAGEVIFVGQASVFSIMEPHHSRICACCGCWSNEELIETCAVCERVYYCDASCAAFHAPYHAVCCPAFVKAKSLLCPEGRVTLEVVLQLALFSSISPEDVMALAARRLLRWQTLEPQQSPPLTGSSRKMKSLELNRLDQYVHVPSDEEFRAMASQEYLPVEWREICTMIHQCLLETCLPSIGESEVQRWISVIHSNAFHTLSPSNVGIGTMICPGAALLNHSCTPNAQSLRPHPTFMCLRTTRRVLAGEELTISYIDEKLSYPKRRVLLRQYGFICKCSACQNGGKSTRQVAKSA